MKRFLTLFLIALWSGCDPPPPRPTMTPPTTAELVGAWTMSTLDHSCAAYLAASGAPVDPAQPPRIEMRADGTLTVARVPLDLAQDRAITLNATGRWRLVGPAPAGPGWELMIVVEEPRPGRGFFYRLRRDDRGLVLRGHFDPDDPGAIEFRRDP